MAKAVFLYPMRDPDCPEKVTLVPCSEEVYYAVMPDIWRGIKQMRKQGLCNCPRHKTGLCDLDCAFCEYKCGSTPSLDAPVAYESDVTIGDTIEDESGAPDMICDNLNMKMALQKLSEYDRKALLALDWYGSERKAAQELGMARSTYKRRLATAKKHAEAFFDE